ncbi:hypothetical protein KFK09_021342 [Dendrobium nobile]|uniref:Uncharacterized protein n=1 Tax=Dendrobium nobile TaxID=94219 RepID=A0A8T3APV2_DENNO|nr:hypothetical protein KFK09_021342 [Dendrobium nobile]
MKATMIYLIGPLISSTLLLIGIKSTKSCASLLKIASRLLLLHPELNMPVAISITFEVILPITHTFKFC